MKHNVFSGKSLAITYHSPATPNLYYGVTVTFRGSSRLGPKQDRVKNESYLDILFVGCMSRVDLSIFVFQTHIPHLKTMLLNN